MKTLSILIKRNSKLFFKDKGLFFVSLITPIILLVLYVTFLKNVYYDSFMSSIPPDFKLDAGLVDGFVGGQLIASLLAVCCITVSFCSNMLMVQDKITGAGKDIATTPVKRSTVATGYYISSVLSTLIICFTAMLLGFIYLAKVGFYLSAGDIILTIVDVILLVLFGAVLSSVVNIFLTSQGQISAVGTIVSAGYGFVCGAYMPISQFGDTLQKVISFLPGTYGTALIKNHMLRGVLAKMADKGTPTQIIEQMKDVVDCNLYFYGHKVEIGTMYLILLATIVVLFLVYILLNIVKKPTYCK